MAKPTYEQLVAENRRLRHENQRLTRGVAEQEAQVDRLTAQVQHALRAAKRQTAPFSKGPPKVCPKPPGRKPGKDYGTPPTGPCRATRDRDQWPVASSQ